MKCHSLVWIGIVDVGKYSNVNIRYVKNTSIILECQDKFYYYSSAPIGHLLLKFFYTHMFLLMLFYK